MFKDLSKWLPVDAWAEGWRFGEISTWPDRFFVILNSNETLYRWESSPSMGEIDMVCKKLLEQYRR